MSKLDSVALANTFAIIDIVLHSLFHLWVSIHSQSYEVLMGMFVAGLRLEVTSFDTGLGHVVFGAIVEAVAFWLLGYTVATLYNRLSKKFAFF